MVIGMKDVKSFAKALALSISKNSNLEQQEEKDKLFDNIDKIEALSDTNILVNFKNGNKITITIS